jgi:hypothetical protein
MSAQCSVASSGSINLDIELPEFWDGWMLHDFRYHYQDYYENVPPLLSFAPRSELAYVDKIGHWVCDRSLCCYPHGMVKKERERLFEDVRRAYMADNPDPPLLPIIKGRQT